MVAIDPDASGQQRFSIRLPSPLAMLASAMAVLIVTGGLLVGIPAYRQQIAVAEIERLSGNVEARPRGPKWMRDLIGEKRMLAFDEVIEVKLRDTRAIDGTLVYVGRLAGLQRLWLANTRLTDAGLLHLISLTSLQELSLAETSVTDAGLLQLRALPRLRWLYLGKTQITSAGAAELERVLPELMIFR